MYVDLMRGYYSSEKPFAMNGTSTGSGVEFSLHKTSFSAGNWERVTMMSYYQTDSVAERRMYKNGYWWANTWTHYPDPTLQLKYTGTLYPMANDTAWVNAGKLVPNFQNEFVVFSKAVYVDMEKGVNTEKGVIGRMLRASRLTLTVRWKSV